MEVIKWVSLDDVDEEQCITGGADTTYYLAVIDSIRANRYCFTGQEHIKHANCIPQVSDGFYLTLDERVFASWMAQAWNELRDDKGDLHCFDWRDFYESLPKSMHAKYPD